MFSMVAFWAALIVLGIWAVRRLNGDQQGAKAELILEQRFARGEIDREEFETRRRVLRQS